MEELKPFITNEYCLRCQGCCRFAEEKSCWAPHLLTEETKTIAPFSKVIALQTNPGQGNFICQFLNPGDNKCNVYPHRPFECKLYPFLINRQGKKVYLSVDLKCPYIKKNVHIEEYKRYVQYLTAFFNNPAHLNILRANPQIVQTYDNVLYISEIKL